MEEIDLAAEGKRTKEREGYSINRGQSDDAEVGKRSTRGSDGLDSKMCLSKDLMLKKIK